MHEVVSYGDMMREYATLRGLRRVLIPVPFLTPRLSGLWLGLVTPAQARVGRALVEGLRNSTVVRSAAAIETFAMRPMTLREAFARAIDEGGAAQFKTDTRLAVVDAPPTQAFAPNRRIGGATGWYFADALWRLRGWIDMRLGGLGMPRTRRDPDDCVVGDVIDGWRVEAYEPDRLLRLSAGLKLSGRGWLEFQVNPLDGGVRSLVRQTATFDPRGVAGRLYWYGVLPLHALVFSGLLRRIAQRAVGSTAPGDLPRFTYSSVIAAPTAEVFAWHEQPGALAALTPAALVRIEQQEGGIRDGGRATVSIGLGRRRVRWSMRHYGCIDGRRFCDVVNRCRVAEGETEARGGARIVDDRSFAKLKVRFAPAWLSWLPMVWGEYWITGLAPDYSWAVVGDPGRDYLWILARAPHLDDDSLAAARAVARDNGFEADRLMPTSQAGAARHDADGRTDRVPNRPHAAGKSRPQTVPDPAAAMTRTRRVSCFPVLERSVNCSRMSYSRGDRVLTHCFSLACLTKTYR